MNAADIETDNCKLKGSLRIALCLPKLGGGADFLQQMQIANGLQGRGHTLTFLAPRDLSEIECTKDLQIPTLAPRTWSKTVWFTIIAKTTWRIQQWLGVPYLNVFSNYCLYDACLQCLPGNDIVQERNGLYKMGVAMACRRLKLPYILFFDADDIFERDFLGDPITGILRWRAAQIIRYSLNAADGIICVSRTTKRRLIDTWKIPQEKIAVFPNAVDVERFRPYPEKRNETRASRGLGDEPVILYVGNFFQWHDVATLLDGFKLVLEAHSNARLFLVGDGNQRKAMEVYTDKLGIAKAVQFTGRLPQAEIPYLVSMADVAVAPYPKMKQAWWGSSLKLFEYLSSGTALVASDIGEQVGDVIQDGKNGLLVSPENPIALAAALKKLIEDPSLRFKLGQQARNDAVNMYSWEKYILRLEQIYQAVSKRQPIHLI